MDSVSGVRVVYSELIQLQVASVENLGLGYLELVWHQYVRHEVLLYPRTLSNPLHNLILMRLVTI